MEINQEALDSLSLADVLALKEYSEKNYNESGNPRFKWIKEVCFDEIGKRLKNIFIF